MKKKTLFLVLLLSVFLFSIPTDAKTQKEEYKNDVLYSQEYFDYVIECASLERQRAIDEQRNIEKSLKKKDQTKIEEITPTAEKKNRK